MAGRPAVYMLLCKDGSLYTGATVDLARRLEAHRRKRGAEIHARAITGDAAVLVAPGDLRACEVAGSAL